MLKIASQVFRRTLPLAVLTAVVTAGSPPVSSRAEPTATPPPAVAAVAPDAAAVVVNGQPIPERIVAAFVRNGQEALKVKPGTPEGQVQLAKLRESVIEELVERALVAQEVRRRGLTASDAQLDAAEARARMVWNDEKRFAEFLRQNGFSREDHREHVLRPAADGPALNAALTRELLVGEDEVKAHWEAHQGDAEFQHPERVTGAHLLVNAQPGVLASQIEFERKIARNTPEMREALAQETERRRQRAEALREEALRPGADWAALVRQHSDDPATREAGGSLGTFSRGAHPLTLDDAFLALAPGEIGPKVVPTQFGFHVVKTLAKLPAGPWTFAEAAPVVRDRLLTTRRAERLREWLKESRARAEVVIAPAPKS